jgi:hypothetical protein
MFWMFYFVQLRIAIKNIFCYKNEKLFYIKLMISLKNVGL